MGLDDVAQVAPDLIMGTAQLAQPYGRIKGAAIPTDASARDLLQYAYTRGLGILDTAPAYGDAERLIGESRLGFEIHTKVGRGANVRDSVEKSLKLLDRDRLDVLYLHDGSDVLDPSSTMLDQISRLPDGQVNAVGASIYGTEEFDAAVADHRVSVVQIPLNVLDRRIDDERLQRAAASGTRVIVRSVYLQGLLVNPTSDALPVDDALTHSVDEFQQVARLLERTPHELALGWVTARPGVTGLIIGMDSPRSVDQLLGSVQAPLTPEELLHLEQLPLPPDGSLDPRAWKAN